MYKYLGNTDIKMYDVFNFISIIALLIMNMSLLKQKTQFLSEASLRFIKKHSKVHKDTLLCNYYFVAFIEILFISLAQYGLVPMISSYFGVAVGTGSNYFGVLYFLPFILMIFFYIINISPLKQLDMITPAYAIALFFVKLACFCAGCCHGIESEFGLYNQKTGLYEIPVQLAEVLLALVIFVFLLLYRKKAKEGTLYPIYMIFYSGVRFFIEFFRHEDDIIWKFKTYHILCIIGVIVGIIEFYIVVKYGSVIRTFYCERGLRAFRIYQLCENVILKIVNRNKKNIVHHKRKKKNKKAIRKR